MIVGSSTTHAMRRCDANGFLFNTKVFSSEKKVSTMGSEVAHATEVNGVHAPQSDSNLILLLVIEACWPME